MNEPLGKAWDGIEGKKKEDEEEKTSFDGPYEIIEDYSDYSTIQGIVYIFFNYQVSISQNSSNKLGHFTICESSTRQTSFYNNGEFVLRHYLENSSGFWLSF